MLLATFFHFFKFWFSEITAKNLWPHVEHIWLGPCCEFCEFRGGWFFLAISRFTMIAHGTTLMFTAALHNDMDFGLIQTYKRPYLFIFKKLFSAPKSSNLLKLFYPIGIHWKIAISSCFLVKWFELPELYSILDVLKHKNLNYAK